MNDDWIRLGGWTIDFMRAVYERNWFYRLMFRIAIGRYAYREFQGMTGITNDHFAGIDFGYDLEGQDYHDTEAMSIFGWNAVHLVKENECTTT